VEESVGRVLKTLDALNLQDDTLVVLAGDNGGVTSRKGRAISRVSAGAEIPAACAGAGRAHSRAARMARRGHRSQGPSSGRGGAQRSPLRSPAGGGGSWRLTM